MTREQIDAIEQLYIESDSLDARSYSIRELIAAARRAVELEEALAYLLDAARARGRLEGLEEAAKIAAEACDVIADDSQYDSCRPRTFADVAAEIRARIEEQA